MGGVKEDEDWKGEGRRGRETGDEGRGRERGSR